MRTRRWCSGNRATDSMRRLVSSSSTTSPTTLDSRSSSRRSPNSELPSSIRGERLVQAGGVGYGALHLLEPIDVPAEALGNLFVGRLALEFGRELVVGAGHLPYLLAHVHGHPYGAPLVGHRPLDGLPDPPGSVGR